MRPVETVRLATFVTFVSVSIGLRIPGATFQEGRVGACFPQWDCRDTFPVQDPSQRTLVVGHDVVQGEVVIVEH